MAKPIVAIVGRPNVGKSTLFNKLAGKRISIVQDTPGVTRDRVYAEAEWLNHTFTMIDTGGIEPENQDIIVKQMRRQANIAIETADVIMFVVDGKEGLTAADNEVATMLRKSKKPVVLVVNKIDNLKNQSQEKQSKIEEINNDKENYLEDEEKIINRINELLEKISNSKSQMSQYKAELIALSQQIESDKAKIKVQESELQKNLEDSDYIINNISISNYNYSNKNGNISTGIIIDIYI